MSISFFDTEAAVDEWRKLESHRAAQQLGRQSYFTDYRLRVCQVIRDYGMQERDGAPADAPVRGRLQLVSLPD